MITNTKCWLLVICCEPIASVLTDITRLVTSQYTSSITATISCYYDRWSLYHSLPVTTLLEQHMRKLTHSVQCSYIRFQGSHCWLPGVASCQTSIFLSKIIVKWLKKLWLVITSIIFSIVLIQTLCNYSMFNCYYRFWLLLTSLLVP